MDDDDVLANETDDPPDESHLAFRTGAGAGAVRASIASRAFLALVRAATVLRTISSWVSFFGICPISVLRLLPSVGCGACPQAF